jgi:hypothetical protein
VIFKFKKLQKIFWSHCGAVHCTRVSKGHFRSINRIEHAIANLSFDFWFVVFQNFVKQFKELMVSKFQKQIFLFSFEPKFKQNYFLISPLGSKMGQIKKIMPLSYYLNTP